MKYEVHGFHGGAVLVRFLIDRSSAKCERCAERNEELRIMNYEIQCFHGGAVVSIS
jgi:hypothetical protein